MFYFNNFIFKEHLSLLFFTKKDTNIKFFNNNLKVQKQFYLNSQIKFYFIVKYFENNISIYSLKKIFLHFSVTTLIKVMELII